MQKKRTLSLIVCITLMAASTPALAGWTNIWIPDHPTWNYYISSIRACKTAVDDPTWGPFWVVNFQVFRKNVGARWAKANTWRQFSDGRAPQLVDSRRNDQWLGNAAGVGVLGDRRTTLGYADKFQVGFELYNGTGYSVSGFEISEIAYCSA